MFIFVLDLRWYAAVRYVLNNYAMNRHEIFTVTGLLVANSNFRIGLGGVQLRVG